MSLVLLVGALLAAVALAACGSSSSPSGSPMSNELSYFPTNSLFVMSVATDPNSAVVKNAQALLSRFPIAALGESAVRSKLQQAGINYDTEVRPLLGNPVALGLTASTTHGNLKGSFLVAWITKDARALQSLVKKLHVQRTQQYDGAALYTKPTGTLAIDGPTAIFASSQAAVMAALDRHAHGGGITGADYHSIVAGLPQNALVQAFGNLTAVLSQPSAAQARRVPWVAALRAYAVSLSASSSGLSVQLKLDTTGGPLTVSELPIASGSGTPGLPGTLPIAVAVRDPAQIITFVIQAEQAVRPAQYAAFAKQVAAYRRKTGIDFKSFLSLLSGDLVVESDTHTTMARVAVSNPEAARQLLSKVAAQPQAGFPHGPSLTPGPAGFYVIKEPRRTVTIGVVGQELVAGNANPAELRAFAAAKGTPAPAGAQGSVAYRLSLPALLQLTLKRAPSPLARNILGSLGNLTGWVAATPSALTSGATLAFK